MCSANRDQKKSFCCEVTFLHLPNMRRGFAWQCVHGIRHQTSDQKFNRSYNIVRPVLPGLDLLNNKAKVVKILAANFWHFAEIVCRDSSVRIGKFSPKSFPEFV